ncbi:MAG: sensor histidine kinase [Propionicimonas sp.]|uniref:ATP-binding protein n=1 Tax=Propionicimonas sp. TaxID=1955623 RepID=UPI003D0CB31B
MHFDVHPSVLFKLGQDLITDDAQALVELIKNAYDADASTVRVDIDTQGWFDIATGEPVPKGSAAPEGAVQGRLRVQDDGVGMSIETIKNGWLTVSNSEKRDFKATGAVTSRGRTPLGDKGLGRLGVQRLGRVVRLETARVGERDGFEAYEVTVDWYRFEGARTLTSVPLDVKPIRNANKAGTAVDVLGLRNVDYWEGRGELDLQKQLASILSPYENAAGLRVFVKINNAEVDTREEARRLLAIAPNLFNFSYERGAIAITALLRSTELRGRNAAERRVYEQLVAPDNGFAFAEWLLSARRAQARGVGAQLGDDTYFLLFSRSVTLHGAAEKGRTVADPGPFQGQISAFSYDRDEDSALDSASELRDFAKQLSGIRVFRDGFGIRLDDDWLGLSAQQTHGGSFYGLRPKNTAGYVNLSARDNAVLEETSSREAFTDTLAWRGFYDLMRAVVRFAADTREFVRRNWLVYQRERLTPTQIDPAATPTEISELIATRAGHAQEVKVRARTVRESVSRLAGVVTELQESHKRANDGIWTDPALVAATEKAVADISSVQAQTESALEQVEQVVATFEDLVGAAELLREKLSVAEEQIERAWESVALGLGAEVLAHEVDQIADRLRGRSHQILEYLRSRPERDPRVIGFVEHVRASASEMSRQVSRLNPSLRFRRETRKVHVVSALVVSAVDYHLPRLERSGIQLRTDVRGDFAIRMNEGKFMQIIDNLVRNSEYWLTREIQVGRLHAGSVAITIDAPRILITDNGPGVEPRVVDTLFEPFVTTKPGSDGRGLGLFVVSQLLDSEGCSIHLGSSLNEAGHPNTFVVDLTAVRTEDTLEDRHG